MTAFAAISGAFARYRCVPLALAMAACLATMSCSRAPAPRPDREITHIAIHKSERRMSLYSSNTVVHRFRVGLGFSPTGRKQERGDGKTPVGAYVIDRRNPTSSFHLSLGISYPNAADRKRAASHGTDPGDNIFIHGEPNNPRYRRTGDWTEGCIAVTNREMDVIYRTVKVGTPVYIFH